jgi:hypothetical protein
MLKKRWKLIVLSIVCAAAAIGAGAFAAFYSRSVGSEGLMQALNYIESGALTDETAEFSRNVETMRSAPTANVQAGAYKNVTTVGNVTYDTAMVLKNDGSYNYAMTVGNSALHKTYQHSGRWWVEGNVFNSVMTEGDLFLAPPAARDRSTPMREIIVESGDTSLKLRAHYSVEPVLFQRVVEKEKVSE